MFPNSEKQMVKVNFETLFSNLYFVNNNVIFNQFQENYNVAVLKVF